MSVFFYAHGRTAPAALACAVAPGERRRAVALALATSAGCVAERIDRAYEDRQGPVPARDWMARRVIEGAGDWRSSADLTAKRFPAQGEGGAGE